jgi:ATP-binding cassette subfamily B protein
VPALAVEIATARAVYGFVVDQTPADRRRAYLQAVLTARSSAKEVRGYQLGGYFSARHDELYEKRLRALAAVVRRRLARGLGGAVLNALITGLALTLVVFLTEAGLLSLASAGAAATALLILGAQVRSLATAAATLYEASLYLNDYSAFVNSARPAGSGPASHATPPATFSEIRVEHVCFTYPNASAPALVDVSIRLPASRVVALVGENGSGKTTLAKLLAGLYQPSAGKITWDGADSSTFDQESLRANVAILFQDFLQYCATVHENIAWGRWSDGGYRARVVAAADAAHALDFITALARGFSTELGPQFMGGTDLSAGQWQRVALARAVFRDAPLVILDEPTAALDPEAEARLFAQLRKVFTGRTVVIVSHRMATVRAADRIYVLRKGRVVEEGTHAELVLRGGRYASMYSVQRDLYEV